MEKMIAAAKAIIGARKIKIKTFVYPETMIDPKPALAIAAPPYPPMIECETLIGRP
jgi:hypothetical protein